MGRKNNNQEESGSGVKKEERPNRVPLNVDLSRAMHEKWLLCNWADVHLPGGGWRLSHRRVPVLHPLPSGEPERTAEIRLKRRYLPEDLRADPAYAIDSDRWHTWRQIETEKRGVAGFLGDRDYPFVLLPRPAQTVTRTHPLRRKQGPKLRRAGCCGHFACPRWRRVDPNFVCSGANVRLRLPVGDALIDIVRLHV
jgi:hypothetical protein